MRDVLSYIFPFNSTQGQINKRVNCLILRPVEGLGYDVLGSFNMTNSLEMRNFSFCPTIKRFTYVLLRPVCRLVGNTN